MSLARLRRSARLVAAHLLLVTAVGLPHRSQADDICVPAGVEEHDESKHVFTTVSEAGHPQHCAVCHWLRWMKPVFSQRVLPAGQQDGRTDLVFLATLSLRDPGSDQLPARAPPSDLT
jgi:hypothetical protein